jgi:hypothetical protein
MNSEYPMPAARNFSVRSGPDFGRLRLMPHETTVPLLSCISGDEILRRQAEAPDLLTVRLS